MAHSRYSPVCGFASSGSHCFLTQTYWTIWTNKLLQYDSSAEYPWRDQSTVLTLRNLLDEAQAASEASSDSNIGPQTEASKQRAIGTANSKALKLSRFCIHHYFDYVAGTSTGGYVSRSQVQITHMPGSNDT